MRGDEKVGTRRAGCARKKDGRWRIDTRRGERERGNTRSANQSHAAPDNQATTIPHHCDHLSFLPRSLSPSLCRPHPLAPAPLSCLYLYLCRAHARALLAALSLPRFLSAPLTPPTPRPQRQLFSLARSLLASISVFLSLVLCSPFSFPVLYLCLYFSLSLARVPLRSARRLARASIEPAEHRPILHLNLVNLPELANELRAWCLILAHEHGRRYTASNASGEGTRVQSSTKFADGRTAMHTISRRRGRGVLNASTRLIRGSIAKWEKVESRWRVADSKTNGGKRETSAANPFDTSPRFCAKWINLLWILRIRALSVSTAHRRVAHSAARRYEISISIN